MQLRQIKKLLYINNINMLKYSLCTLLALSTLSFNVDSVNAKSFSSSSSSKSSPATSSSTIKSSSFNNNSGKTVDSKQTTNNRTNNNSNRDNKANLTVNDGSVRPTNNVNASYTVNTRASVTNKKPPDSIVSTKTYTVDNPNKLPTTPVYVTKYGADNKPYSVLVIAPIGYDSRRIIVSDDYYPPSYRSSSVVYTGDNYSASGFIGVVLFCGVIFIMFVIARN